MRARPLRFLAALFGTHRPKDNRRKFLSRLERNLGYFFKDLNLLETALSHQSYINESGRKNTESNERLEFLGDAVLDLIVSEYLYSRYLSAREGALTRIKSSIVSRTALARQASKLRLEDYILYSKDSFSSLKRGEVSIISNSLEALIGAIYLDGGLEAARRFVYQNLLGGGKVRLSYDSLHESKNRLLHLSQVNYHCQPAYKVVEVSGPEHAKQFVCEVAVAGEIFGKGVGTSKKEAEKQAAQAALQLLASLGKTEEADS
ncbi:MAG TPA: ribonuclease III [archaeon]|nr:ribonuclease III [archaeon]